MKHLRPRTRSVAVGRKWKEGERERGGRQKEKREEIYCIPRIILRHAVIYYGKEKTESWVIVIKVVSSDNI